MGKPVHKYISLLFGIAGILNFLSTFFGTVTDCPFCSGYELRWWSYPLLGVGIYFLWTYFCTRERVVLSLQDKTVTVNMSVIIQYSQFGFIYLISIFVAFHPLHNNFTMELLFLALLLGLRYQLIKIRGSIFMGVTTSIAFEFAAFQNGTPLDGLYVLIFAGAIIFVLLLIHMDFLKIDSSMHERILHVETRLNQYEKETLDPGDFPFTPRELDVLKALCLTHGSNSDIASGLGIKEQTVKGHLKNIFDKAGVDDRHQLVDLFRHAFIMDDDLDH